MQTMHLSCIKISTISKQTGPSFHLSLFTFEYQQIFQNGFLDYGALGANYAPILHQNKHCLQIDQTKIPYDTRHLWGPSGVSKLISEHVVLSMQTVHLSCNKISTISK